MGARGVHYALKGLEVEHDTLVLLLEGSAGAATWKVPLQDIVRLVGVMSGDDWHQQVLDFFVLDLGQHIGPSSWDGETSSSRQEEAISSAPDVCSKASVARFLITGAPAWGSVINVKPALHPRSELEEVLAREGGISIDREPTSFAELKWNP